MKLVSKTLSPDKSGDFHDIKSFIPTLAEVGCVEDDGNCNICQEFIFDAAVSRKILLCIIWNALVDVTLPDNDNNSNVYNNWLCPNGCSSESMFLLFFTFFKA